MPELQLGDLQPGNAGVRAQAVDAEGKLVDDFRIATAPRMVHVLNAPSPAATASIAIGHHMPSSPPSPSASAHRRGHRHAIALLNISTARFTPMRKRPRPTRAVAVCVH